MTGAEAVQAIEKVAELAGKFPDLLEAVEGVTQSLRRKEDPTPAVKHAQRLAAERFLGIEEP